LLALADLCQKPYKKRYGDAVRFYGEAFSDAPELAGDQPSMHRYNAACAAALAGCGEGVDADKLKDKERARLRRQALDWLRDDLKSYRLDVDKAGPAVAQQLQHWFEDTDFSGVRGTEALSKLSDEAERAAWQKLWKDVETVRQRAATNAPTKDPAPK
jgi:hypothetical protein